MQPHSEIRVCRVRTLQVGHKLIILDKHHPLRYVNLITNEVHQYSEDEQPIRMLEPIEIPEDFYND